MSKKNKGKKKNKLAGKWEEIKRNMEYYRLTGKRSQRKSKR
jgi:hypothetical protein